MRDLLVWTVFCMGTVLGLLALMMAATVFAALSSAVVAGIAAIAVLLLTGWLLTTVAARLGWTLD